ncbi:MAG: DUF3575 domain-containing protein, partial [Chitinophagaceae bacterium]
MRKSTTLLLAATLLCGAVSAQSEKEKIKVQTGDPKPWVVKWNPAGLVFGDVALHGEYNHKRKKSVTFGVGIPVENSFHREEEGSDYRLTNKTFFLQGGYRMYFGKKPMRGVYFEPFLKYVNYKGSGLYDEHPGIANDEYEITASSSTFGIGAQLGVQFVIAKVVTLDLFLLGPQANIGKMDVLFLDRNQGNNWDAAGIERARAEREVRD